MTGYDLAKRILYHPQGGVEALLRLSCKEESFWLELKAGVNLCPEDVAKGESEKELCWNIASAVLELINTAGGVVLIGVQNTTLAPVPLSENDPRRVIEKEGLEAYRRKEIEGRIWRRDKRWTTPKNVTWEIQDPVPFSLVEVVGCRCRDADIAAILVKPVEGPCIRIWKNDVIEEIRARKSGDVGDLLEIIGSRKMEAYDKEREEERQKRSEHFGMLYENFLAEAEAASADAEILRKIEEYYARFEEKTAERRRFDLSCFTPLDASGGMTEEEQPEEFMSPEAVELIESNDWLDGDGEEPEDGDAHFREDEDGDGNEDGNEGGNEEERNPDHQASRSGDLLTLMNEIPRISILGEPGGGKTTTLLRFALQFCRERSESPVLAVFIPMGQWREGGSIALLLNRITGLTLAQWEQLIREKRLRLIIDAVNECPDQFRRAAVLNIRNFLREYPDVPAAVSARTDEDLKTLRLPTFTVRPMDRDHQRLYLTKYLKDETRADEIMQRLAAMSGGMEIAANPMLLRLVVEVVREDNELPSGRAALYRKWLHQWYARESGKHRSAGEALPWSERETLKIFSVLAFQSRLQGYRDVPAETAALILQKYGPGCVEKLCQGPVVTADDDYIRFRHESFQEYLCAEYLIGNFSALPALTSKDYASWGMPVAYASELLQPLPDPLLSAAWQMNPWFGFALTDKENHFDISSATARLTPEWQSLFEHISAGDWNCSVTVKSLRGWYFYFDRNLIYLIATNPRIMSRWHKMELWRLSMADSPLAVPSILFHSLALRSGPEPASWKDTWSHILPLAESEGLPAGLIRKLRELSQKRPWMPYAASTLITHGFAEKDDFADMIPKWIRQADTPGKVRRLIAYGLADEEDFSCGIQDPRKTRNALEYAFGILQAMLTAGDEETFETRRPAEWPVSFAFFQAHLDEFKLITSLLQSVAASGIQEKRASLLRLIDSREEFKCILQSCQGALKMTPVSSAAENLPSPPPAAPLTIRHHTAPGKEYHVSAIVDETSAEQIRQELAGKKWIVTAINSFPTFSFFSHAAFPDNIFCHNATCLNGIQPEVGSTWEAEISVKWDEKKLKYNFSVVNARPLGSPVARLTAPGPVPDGAEAGPGRAPAAPPPRSASGADGGDAGPIGDPLHPPDAPADPPVIDGAAAVSDTETTAYAGIAQILQTLCGAKKESVFQAKCPSDWHISFAFCRTHGIELNKLISLLQSLANSAKLSEGVIKSKQNELARLVRSHREFEAIFPDMEPPAAKPAIAGRPAAVPVKVDYDPVINLSGGVAAVRTITDFSRDASHIRIYLDETWPGTQDKEYGDIGVIAGIVWAGSEPDETRLPMIQTHIRTRSPGEFRKAIDRLLKCRCALPFIFPITKRDITMTDYPLMLRIALQTLLGWILPQNGRPCDVEIFAEGIGQSGMSAGVNYAASFQEMCNTVRCTSGNGRMSRWHIRSVFSMPEDDEGKNFEYIPYGDAVAYLAVPTEKARQYGAGFDAERTFPAYVPISPELLNWLNRLDTFSPRGYAETLFEFAKEHHETKLYSFIVNEAVEHAQNDADFRDALFNELEEMFSRKERDLAILSSLTRILVKRFPVEMFDGSPRQKSIRLLVELQNANHSGRPEDAAACVEKYRLLRGSLLEDNRELCAYTDMNLAVHYNDLLDFGKAASVCRPWEQDPSFDHLGLRIRGQILSSIGQGYAFAGDFVRGYEYFRKALQMFGNRLDFADEIDQTAVYCALDVLDNRYFPQALRMAEAVFQCEFSGAVAKYGDNLYRPFHHHLLVKNLFFNPEAGKYIPLYLARRDTWQNKPQHPWELIELYRILLLHRQDPESAKERTAALWQLYGEINGGGIMDLLEVFARCVISVTCGDTECVQQIFPKLGSIEADLPLAANICQKLGMAAAGELSAEEIWPLLPFNYK